MGARVLYIWTYGGVGQEVNGPEKSFGRDGKGKEHDTRTDLEQKTEKELRNELHRRQVELMEGGTILLW